MLAMAAALVDVYVSMSALPSISLAKVARTLSSCRVDARNGCSEIITLPRRSHHARWRQFFRRLPGCC
jgi:hypothetical protein